MIIKSDSAQIQSYLRDSSNISGGWAESVVLPERECEIAEFLADCSATQTPVTISAGRTGTVGGGVPFGGKVLSTEKLNRIIDLDRIQAGVFLADLQKEVTRTKLFYPPDATEQLATIGGNTATNAAGARSYAYGSSRDFIRRIKLVLSTGQILNIRRGECLADRSGIIRVNNSSIQIPRYLTPKIKTSSGYYAKPGLDLIDLFIGSEGTLGVITEVELKLLKSPNYIFECLAFFGKESEAFSFVEQARKIKNVLSLEFFDKNSLNLLKSKYSQIPDSGAAILFEQAERPEDIDKWGEYLENCERVWFAEDSKTQKLLKEIRHALPEMLSEHFNQVKVPKISTDIAVPADKLSEMYNYYKQILEKENFKYVIFGHIGQSHLHLNILPKDQAEYLKAKKVYSKFVQKSIQLGGTISAEHGIGKLKRDYLLEMLGQAAISEMKRVKQVLDPAGILGRGNIFAFYPNII